jgi:hypothetical protein
MRDIIKEDVVTSKNVFLAAVRTPAEIISEQIQHNRIVEQFSTLTNPSRLEISVADLFGRLLKTGANENIFKIENPHRNDPVERQFEILRNANLSDEGLNDLKLINARYEYAELVQAAFNGKCKLIETDLSIIFSKSPEEIERDASHNLMVVARYFEFLRRTVEKNFTEQAVWAHFSEKGLDSFEKFEDFGDKRISTILLNMREGLSFEGISLKDYLILFGAGQAITTIPALATSLLLKTPFAEIKSIVPVCFFVGQFVIYATMMAAQFFRENNFFAVLPLSRAQKMVKSIMRAAKDIEALAATERESMRIISKKTSNNLLKELGLATYGITREDATTETSPRLPQKEEA